MKYLKTREEFHSIDEQLFGKVYGKLMDLLGMGDPNELKDVGISPVNGQVISTVPGDKGKNIQALIDAMKRQGITNPYTQIAILGVIGKETGFIPKNEIGYGTTSNKRIRKIFGSRVKDLSDAELDAIKKDDVKFFDRVYGPGDPTGKSQQYGNSQPGDGYKYRGRGFNGITFKSGYAKIQGLLDKMGKLEKKVDIVNNPDSLNELEVAAEAAVLYFLSTAKSPMMYQKYGVKDINGFKDQETALKAMTNANAGWGNDITSDYLGSLDKARQQASNFRIDASGSAALA